MLPALDYELVRHTLSNGLEVCVVPDTVAPAVAVNLWYEVGSFDEVAGRTGFAHLFEHLMFQGSGQVDSGEHMALVEANGGSVNATTSVDRTNYFETVPPGALELALWLEADRMGSLAITAAHFAAQREVVKEEKRQRYDNQPYGDVLELLVAQHFDPAHPYGHLPIGAMEHLDAASLDDVAAFFQAWYRPSNARLVISGAVAPEVALELVERHFGNLAHQPRPGHAAAPASPTGTGSSTVHRVVPHSLLYSSWLTPPAADVDHLALDLALGILTDGHTSRLHRRLVKQDQIAHEVHGFSMHHLRDRSLTLLLARPADGVCTEAVADALRGGLAEFAEHGPTEDELQRAVAQQERDWLLELATVEGRADLVNDLWLRHGDPSRVNTRLAELAALTPDDVREAVATHLGGGPPTDLHYIAQEDAR